MYKIVSARDPKALEDLLNAPNVKQVYTAWVYNGTPYALIQIEEVKVTPKATESKPEPKAKPKTPRKPRKKTPSKD